MNRDAAKTQAGVAIAGLYGMVDPTFGNADDQLRILVNEGIQPIQLRCKSWPREAVRALALRWESECRLVINDDAELASELGLLVHLGHEDGAALGPYGRSTHTIDQVRAARGANYIGFGPVFATSTKVQGWPVAGVRALAEAASTFSGPVVAIGGISVRNIDAVRESGVAGWAVLASIWRATDPKTAIRDLKK